MGGGTAVPPVVLMAVVALCPLERVPVSPSPRPLSVAVTPGTVSGSNVWFANQCNMPAKLNSSIKKATMQRQQLLKAPITTKPQAESFCYK